MATSTCKYYHRISFNEYVSFASYKKEMLHLLKDGQSWCRDCKAVVDMEGGLDKLGLYNKCPFCGGRF